MGNQLIMRQLPWEALVWLSGLVWLALAAPEGAWSVCPLHNLGIEFCPGCGLGRSVSHIFHGEWSEAWSAHPLGFLALPLLLFRSFTLLRKYFINNNNHHGTSTRPVT